MNKEEYIKLRIESKLISKIANHRLMTRDAFRNRHQDAFPEVGRSQCSYHLNELRVWLKMAQRMGKVLSQAFFWPKFANSSQLELVDS